VNYDIPSPRMDISKPLPDGHYWALGTCLNQPMRYIDGGPFVTIVRVAGGKVWKYPLYDGRTWEHELNDHEIIEPVVPGEDPEWLRRCRVCGDWQDFGPYTDEEIKDAEESGRLWGAVVFGGRCLDCEDEEQLLEDHEKELEFRLKALREDD